MTDSDPTPSGDEKIATSHHDDLKSNAHQIAERGHAATDMFVLRLLACYWY
jgi:hypothetical protein